MKVAVVGGGPSGLVTAKTLLEFGHDVILLERDACIGGVWSRLRGYPLLRLLNTKHSFRFSTLCMPRNFDLFPTKDQVSHYLDMYVAQHNLAKITRLGANVNALRPRSDGTAGWILTMNASVEESFDYVVVCTGPFSRPFVPELKGREAFEAGGGLYLHSSEVLDRSLLQNKRVIIVGFGQSAMEIANLAAASHAKQITIAARQVTWKLPTSFLGLFPLQRLLANRFGETLLSITSISSWWKRTLRAVILSLVELSARCEYKLGSNNLLPKSDLATAIQSSDRSDLQLFAGKISCEAKGRFFNLIDQGTISIVRDDHIRELKADGSVEMSSGARPLSADVVILATGYQRALPSFVTEHKTLNCDLYRGILPSDSSLNGLSFVGTQPHSSAMNLLIAELSALWIARHLEGRIYLPTIDEQKRERQPSGPFAHTDALLSDLGADLGWFTRFFRQGLLCIADDLTVYEGVWDRVAEIRAAEIQTGKLILPSLGAATAPNEQRTYTPDERTASDEKIEASDDEQPTMPGTLSMEMCSEEEVEEEELQIFNDDKEEEIEVREEIEEATGDDTVVLSPKLKGEGESNCVKTEEGVRSKVEIIGDDRSVHAIEDSDGLKEKEVRDKKTDDDEKEKVEKVQGSMQDAIEYSDDVDEIQIDCEEDAGVAEAISCKLTEPILEVETNEAEDATALEMADLEYGATMAEDSEERRSVNALKRALSFLPRRHESASDTSSSIESTRPPSVISLSKCRLVSKMATASAPSPRKTGSESHPSTSNESTSRANVPFPSSKHARMQDPLGVRLLWKRHKPSDPALSPSLHSPPPKARSQIFQPMPSPSLSRSSFSSSTAPSLTSSSSSASSGGRSSSLRTPALLDRLDNCSTAAEVVAAFHKQQQDRERLSEESPVEYASQLGCPLVKPIPRRGALTTPPNLMKPPDFIRITSDGLLEVVDAD